MKKARDLAFLVFDGVTMLDVVGPMEVFAEANLSGLKYRISVLTVDGQDVRASSGMRLASDGSAFEKRHWDTVLVAGGEPFPASPVPDPLADAARYLASRTGRMAAICTGVFVLGAAGLLDGRHATTHWRHARELARRCPHTSVELDWIFIRDHDTYTSAGVTAGIDLALSLLEDDHGADVARAVARSLVVFMHRSGGRLNSPPQSIRPRHVIMVSRRVVGEGASGCWALGDDGGGALGLRVVRVISPGLYKPASHVPAALSTPLPVDPRIAAGHDLICGIEGQYGGARGSVSTTYFPCMPPAQADGRNVRTAYHGLLPSGLRAQQRSRLSPSGGGSDRPP